jgi:FixJ family two-component response regulator
MTPAADATTATTIWIVDDDPSVGPALRRMLRAHDIDCLLLTSAQELLDHIGPTRPTIVLLDIHMPGTSGLEALRAMRARGIDVPTVMMTGVERDGTRASCLAAGAAEVLGKPVDARTITRLLDRFTTPPAQA